MYVKHPTDLLGPCTAFPCPVKTAGVHAPFLTWACNWQGSDRHCGSKYYRGHFANCAALPLHCSGRMSVKTVIGLSNRSADLFFEVYRSTADKVAVIVGFLHGRCGG